MEFPGVSLSSDYTYIYFPLFAYSTRKIAEKIPKGTAIIRDNSVINNCIYESRNYRRNFQNCIPVKKVTE